MVKKQSETMHEYYLPRCVHLLGIGVGDLPDQLLGLGPGQAVVAISFRRVDRAASLPQSLGLTACQRPVLAVKMWSRPC